MGFFSKHKKESNTGELPPVTPADANLPPLPPPAPMESSPQEDLSLPPIPSSVEDGATLSPPPIPGGNFDDIKNQVVNESPGFREDSLPPIPQGPIDSEIPQASSSEFDLNDDSLFDMSDLEKQSEPLPQQEEPQVDSMPPQEIEVPHIDDMTQETNLDKNQSFNFISSRNVSGRAPQGSFFVTTQQFREMLDIIDSVKGRVKESTDTHLRLLDIKSEEDIEYENLRKDFQYIEDKLYELDNLVFEK
jgi:hypothetical protein